MLLTRALSALLPAPSTSRPLTPPYRLTQPYPYPRRPYVFSTSIRIYLYTFDTHTTSNPDPSPRRSYFYTSIRLYFFTFDTPLPLTLPNLNCAGRLSSILLYLYSILKLILPTHADRSSSLRAAPRPPAGWPPSCCRSALSTRGRRRSIWSLGPCGRGIGKYISIEV